MFEKQKLSMHLTSSRRYARIIKHLVYDLKKEFKELDEFDHEFKDAVKKRNIDHVKKGFEEFLKNCRKSEKDIEEIKKDEFIIEHRLLKHLKEVENELSNIKDSVSAKEQEELKKDYQELENVFNRIISSLKKEKIKARDLKRDHEKLRDKTMLSNALVFHLMKVAARHEKRDAGKEKKEEKQVLDELHEIIKLAKEKEEIPHSRIKKLAKDLKEYEESILEEFKEALKVEDELIVIAFRLQDLNEEELKNLHSLLQSGFPRGTIDEIDAEEKEFFNKLKDQEREDYKYARALLGESKDLT